MSRCTLYEKLLSSLDAKAHHIFENRSFFVALCASSLCWATFEKMISLSFQISSIDQLDGPVDDVEYKRQRHVSGKEGSPLFFLLRIDIRYSDVLISSISAVHCVIINIDQIWLIDCQFCLLLYRITATFLIGKTECLLDATVTTLLSFQLQTNTPDSTSCI